MQDFNSMNDPHMVTPTGDFTEQPPKGEPIAKAPQAAPEPLCDPRTLLNVEPVERADVQAGDFIRAGSWTQPRHVEHVDVNSDGNILFLAEHDTARIDKNGLRIVDEEEWRRRDGWVRYPNLRRLWDAAHCDS